MMRAIIFILSYFLSTYALAEIGVLLPEDAFNAGKAFANEAKAGAANQVNDQMGKQNLPYYSNQAHESGHFHNGKGLVGTFGVNKQTGCKTFRAENDFLQQECDAVNFLSKNSTQRQKFVIDKKTDPLLVGSKEVINSPGTIPGTHTQNCRVITEKTPAAYQKQTCIEAHGTQTITCHRGANVNIGAIPQTYSVNQGSNVPPWSARTFQLNMTVTGTPLRFTLTRYQIDNYGQLWINQRLVYSNAISGLSDMRDGVVRGGTYITRNGQRTSFGDDGCNWGCRGTNPNLDITQHIQEGENTITLVCANANEMGPCAINISGSSNQFLGAIINNGCEALEARAR